MSTEPPPVEDALGEELGRAMSMEPDPVATPTPDWSPVRVGVEDTPSADARAVPAEPAPEWSPVEPAA